VCSKWRDRAHRSGDAIAERRHPPLGHQLRFRCGPTTPDTSVT
jgi:hypothetical protein